MANYYIEFSQTVKETDSDVKIISAASKAEAKKKLKEELKEEFGDSFISVKIDDIYKTSDDARI